MKKRGESRMRAKPILGLVVSLVAVASLAAWGLATASAGPSATNPEFTEVEPMPAEVLNQGWEAVLGELDFRVADWTRRAAVDEMTDIELAAGIDELFKEVATQEESPDEWLKTNELMRRLTTLCQALPASHPYRGGEFCE